MIDEVQKKNNNQQEDERKEKDNEDGLAKCQKERDEYLDGWKRAKAELINYKKDESKRFEEIVKFSREGLVAELISVLDSFDLALVSLEADADHKTQKGLYLIRTQLEDVLRKNGLERMIVSIGQPFDPRLQEAIVSVESDKPAGTVIEEVEKGYLLYGKIIRPARVKVAK